MYFKFKIDSLPGSEQARNLHRAMLALSEYCIEVDWPRRKPAPISSPFSCSAATPIPTSSCEQKSASPIWKAASARASFSMPAEFAAEMDLDVHARISAGRCAAPAKLTIALRVANSLDRQHDSLLGCRRQALSVGASDFEPSCVMHLLSGNPRQERASHRLAPTMVLFWGIHTHCDHSRHLLGKCSDDSS